MEEFLARKKRHPQWATQFEEELERLRQHPSRRYFIYKSIIVSNLFGVDILEEAVEIAKLRMFLKLMAEVEDVDDVEPLPDIDFNILAGNTLVGYASLEEIEKAKTGKFDFGGIVDRVRSVDRSIRHFRDLQTQHGFDAQHFRESKANLQAKLHEVQAELNKDLATEYGARDLDAFIASHKPLHWYVEFNDIIQRGGFDVVLGNPPYVRVRRITDYTIRGYETDTCPDIYAACIERSLRLLGQFGRFGLILPISFQFSMDFEAARRVCRQALGPIWVSAFSRNPAALFAAGLGVRNTICIGRSDKTSAPPILCTRLLRWVEECRPMLFQSISYTPLPRGLEEFGWPRLDSPGLAELFSNLAMAGGSLGAEAGRGQHELRFKTTALYYISAFVADPPSFDEFGRAIEHTKVSALRFANADARDLSLIVALGKLACLWWAATGDDFDVTGGGLGSTPVDPRRLSGRVRKELLRLAERAQEEMANNVIYTKYAGKWMGNYDVKCIREITDAADILVLRDLGLDGHWEDVELAYARFMKATGERPGTRREPPDFGS